MTEIRIASENDIDNLIPLVGQYHRFESVDSSYEHRKNAISPLQTTGSPFGFVLIATSRDEIVGYIAICFGYGIESGGREAFVDEFYLVESKRDQGIGSKLLETVKKHIKTSGIYMLHLEIAADNNNGKNFYKKQGFISRNQFHLMSCNL